MKSPDEKGVALAKKRILDCEGGEVKMDKCIQSGLYARMVFVNKDFILSFECELWSRKFSGRDNEK